MHINTQQFFQPLKHEVQGVMNTGHVPDDGFCVRENTLSHSSFIPAIFRKVPAGSSPSHLPVFQYEPSARHSLCLSYIMLTQFEVWIFVLIHTQAAVIQFQLCMRWMESIIDCWNRMMLQSCGCSQSKYIRVVCWFDTDTGEGFLYI